MGFYLNNASSLTLYKSEVESPYFVDKSRMLAELFPLTELGNKHVCITRPRRFGKTVMANMVGAFFGKGADAGNIFDSLKIAKEDGYRKHLNRYDVIYIDFSKMPEECNSYNQYINRISRRLKRDLEKSYPNADIEMEDALWVYLMNMAVRSLCLSLMNGIVFSIRILLRTRTKRDIFPSLVIC